ncbi:DUF6232 family protein [Streptomyces sp. NBC_00582]|uniref:DUF6232 family protein n=1 Tax=Streptomyces sp. NBC_00582 TaxID=2975783 RepID=UPI0010D77836|nr:DUF6232 family protein [Streptomyces sp. NBC_00582]WUB62988.1 DUF6232 family protein [Streptomyces sp. NBC_00582]
MVQVRVNEGVLWVEGEAYPLRNISHVGQRVLEVDRRAAWKTFIQRSLIWLFVGGFLASFGVAAMLIWLAVHGFLIWQLVKVLNRPTLYGLVLNTSGTQRDAVWSTERDEITFLVGEITKAIGHPDIAQITYNVQHAVQGDIINQYGDHNVGKNQHSGSGNIVGSR